MSDKPILILLHGALGSRDQFNDLESHLSDSFRIYTLNFEGHGGRNSSRPFSIDIFKENLLEMMEQENIEAAHIFGFSMGGYVALKLAIDHPAKVDRIMTLGTKFAWSPDIASQEVSRLNPIKIEAKLPEFAKELEQRHAPMDWHQVLSKTGAMMVDLGDGKGISTDKFEQVKCPVLITLGSKDQMVSVAESEEVADTIRKGKFHLFEGFKHPLEQIDTELLAGKIREFFTMEKP